MEKKKRGIPLIVMLLLIGLVPLLAVGLTTLFLSVSRLESQVAKETTMRLKTIAHDTKNYFGVDWNDWMQAGVTDDDYVFVDAHLDEGIVITIFKEDTRYISAIRDEKGERISGTKANDNVINTVYKGGEDYTAENVDINGKPYFVYYSPIEVDGKIVGMAFCGEEMSKFNNETREVRNSLLVLFVVCAVVCAVLVVLVSLKLKKPFGFIASRLSRLAEGYLDVDFNCGALLRETRMMMDSSRLLRNELNDIVGNIKDETLTLSNNASRLTDIADSTNYNIDKCNTAVDGIARGANESAESTESIANQCTDLEQISSNVSGAMADMKASAGEALDISSNAKKTMTTLENISDETQEIVDDISEQMREVNVSLSDVKSIVTAIADITAQTTLLSLNASIEAARAGEAGRGFAVVADEIRELADSSAENADKISNIINSLVSEITKTTELTERLVEHSSEQVKQLGVTGEEFDKCIEEINLISGNVDRVNDETQGLNAATHAVNDAVTTLSAITEENSASAQETTVSMTESSKQVSMLTDNAKDIEEISGKLKNLVSRFKG